jgi:hypothetical protein
MKTSVEISGYTISIEENDGVISVNAVKDEEVVEEFTIEVEESEGQEDFDYEGEAGEGEEVKPFGDYEEEEDFGSEEFDDDEEEFGQEDDEEGVQEDDDDDDDDDDDEVEKPALESFQSFINKKRK